MMGGHIHLSHKANETVLVRHTEEVVCGENGVLPLPKHHLSGTTMHPATLQGYPITLINLTKGTRTQITGLTDDTSSGSSGGVVYTQVVLDGTKAINFKNPSLIENPDGVKGDSAGAADSATTDWQYTERGDRVRIFWVEQVTQAASGDTKGAVEITISPDTFSGTYRVVGDTFIRSQETGKDEAFQFVIERAKVLSEITLTLEAEGDPSTFDMSLSVLRAENERGEKEMMKLVRYNMEDTGTTSGTDWGSLRT